MNVVEYALDVIQEAQDYPDGLQRLVEYQVSTVLLVFYYYCCTNKMTFMLNKLLQITNSTFEFLTRNNINDSQNGDLSTRLSTSLGTYTRWICIYLQRKAYTIEENREQFTYQPSPLAMAGGMTDKEQPVFANSFVPELAILMHRELLSFLRTPAVFFIRIVLAVSANCSPAL